MSSVHFLRDEDPINEFSCGWHGWSGSLHLIAIVMAEDPSHAIMLCSELFLQLLAKFGDRELGPRMGHCLHFCGTAWDIRDVPILVQGEGFPCADPCTQGGCGSPRMSLSTQTHPRQHLHPSSLRNTRDQYHVRVTVGGTSWVALRHRGCVHLIPQRVWWWAGVSAWT